jgi:hypothetical protein
MLKYEERKLMGDKNKTEFRIDPKLASKILGTELVL